MAILSVTIPFFALVLIGYLAARVGVVPVAAVPGLNSYVLYFALPALLFQLGARTPIVELLDPVILGMWLLAAIVIITLAVWSALRRGLPWLDASYGGLVAVLSNSGFMGVPLITALIGDEAGGPIITALLIDVVALQSIAAALSQRDHIGDTSLWEQVRISARRVVANPLPWGIVLGVLVGASGLALPSALADIIDLLGSSATPVALFTIGAVLYRQQLIAPSPGRVRTGVRAYGDVYWLAALKLVVHPLIVWGLGRAVIAAGLPLSETALVVLVLLAALPSAANASIVAERAGADNGRIARVILVSTVLGFFTFSALAPFLTH